VSARFRMGELVVEPDAGRILRGKEELRLQPLGWQMLMLLLREPERLFSREELFEILWPGVHVTDASLSQLIRRIRAALGEEVVETVPRLGYRLGAAAVIEETEPGQAEVRSPPDRFYGREPELRSLLEALSEGTRLITLTGPGGVGKTRLATELARQAGLRSWRVDVASARDAGGVALAVADALDLTLGGDPMGSVGASLRLMGRVLLLLDDFEGAVHAAPETVAAWLGAAPQLGIVVTSRVVLGLRGERIVRVDPLPAPDAVRLLCDRAGGPLAPAEAHRLVEALDGLPLAIELAAARTRVLSVEQLLERLRHTSTLSASPGDRPARHSSLDAALRASWDPLEEPLRRALVRLGVFEGAFGMAAAEAVLDPGGSPLDVLQELADRSWLRAEPGSGQISMLSILRGFVLGQAGPEPLREAQERHGRWFARLGQPEVLTAIDAGQPPGHAVLDAALRDLVAACRSAVARGDAEVTASTALAAATVLMRRGPLSLARELLEAAEAMPGLPRRGPILGRLGGVLTLLGRPLEGIAVLEQQLAWGREQGDPRSEAFAELDIGKAMVELGQLERGIEWMTRALPKFDALQDRSHQVLTLLRLSQASWHLGQSDRALDLTDQALEIFHATGLRRREEAIRQARGLALWSMGRLAEAARELERAQLLLRARDDLLGLSSALEFYAIVLGTMGRWEEAIVHQQESVDRARQLGQGSLCGRLANLGRLLTEAGHPAPARAALAEALAHCDAYPGSLDLAFIHLSQAALEMAEGELDAALPLLDGALQAASQGPEARLVAQILAQRGLCRAARGERAEAQEDLRAAEEVYGKMGVDAWVERVLEKLRKALKS
jgi:DNA-binding winged helix-turn-helix (wHTH) protein/tetratricopeptide (TPR) repeat protein